MSSFLGGVLANLIFTKIWKRPSSSDAGPPGALEPRSGLPHILLAAALQGAIFALVKVVVDRGGAHVFQRWSGEWPAD